MRNARDWVKKIDEESSSGNGARQIQELDRQTQRAFSKAIITLRVAMNTLGEVIGEVQENWIIYEILMQHKNVLHSQIDILIKQKRKI
jgi:ParB family chromosome partitioning protein